MASKTKDKFIGTILWDTFDVVTFGAFEKAKNETLRKKKLKDPPYKN